MFETTHSLCPIVRDELMQLWINVEVAGEYRMMPIARRILWLRESSSYIVYRHRGVEIREGSTINDFYGFCSSIEGAIEEVPRLAKTFKILRGDALTIDVETEIVDCPMLPDDSEEGKSHNAKYDRKQYLSVRHDRSRWFTSDKPLSDERYAPYPVLESRIVVARHPIYSTATEPISTKIPKRIQKRIDELSAFVASAPLAEEGTANG